jgi:methylphosphotriester-DNA--protein-cysteine methyltransferase
MPDDHAPHTTGAPAASLVDAADRAAALAALRPALETLASQAGTDPRLSLDARRVLRAITGTRPQDTLTLAAIQS